MDRTDVAYLINSTPKYYFLLDFHLTLLKRYAPELKWPLFIASEVPEHSVLQGLKSRFQNLTIIPLTQEFEGFIESRFMGTQLLPPEIKYVFPIQEDFLLEARPVNSYFEEALQIFDTDTSVASIRMMPCPGPKGNKIYGNSRFKVLEYPFDDMIFTYQATLWRRESYQNFMGSLAEKLVGMTPERKRKASIQDNIAEIAVGQKILVSQNQTHLAYPREGRQPNAVYLSPFPYRPTAVVKGKLEEWALDLSKREAFFLE
jgi:hypothetical protein